VVPETQLDQARKAWDEFDIDAVRSVAWLAIASIGEPVNRFPPTASVVGYIDQLLAEAFPDRRRFLKGAAVVCGDMEAERGVFEGVTAVNFTDVDGFDLSEKSLERVRPSAFAFHPKVADCNDLVLEPETYDLIVAAHGIHHIFNVGGLFYQLNKALRPGGVLFIHEWIGPERLQIPRSNSLVSWLLLSTLFTRRERTTHEKRIKGPFLQCGPECFEPSEACNSTEIRQHFRKYFDIRSEFTYGGLCYPMFEGLGRNFSGTKAAAGARRIKAVIHIERWLMSLGIIQPLFLVGIAQKKPVWK
jgi:SAM-dependent methyltransferase